MTRAGMALVEAAKANGMWNKRTEAETSFEMPSELKAALGKNKAASKHFDKLSPSCKRHYIGWVASANRSSCFGTNFIAWAALLLTCLHIGCKQGWMLR